MALCRTCGGYISSSDDCLTVEGAYGQYGRRLFFCRWFCLAAYARAEGDPVLARQLFAQATRGDLAQVS